jgi:hypothetical protein
MVKFTMYSKELKMTRKDYVLIVEAIREGVRHTPVPVEHLALESIGRAFADRLQQIYPRFDRSRFMKALMEDEK